MPNVLFAAHPDEWPAYAPHLRQAFSDAGLGDILLATGMPAEVVDYIIYAPDSALSDFTPFTRCKAVLSLWAGVEGIVGNQSLTLPLCRMVDPALKQGMVEWVTGHVLRHHLGMDAHIKAAPGQWEPEAAPLAWERPVTVLGLGELGRAAAEALAQVGFPVTGWSRSPREVPRVRCLHGEAGLEDALNGAEIVVLLLPRTGATENVLDAGRLALLKHGAVVINPGRGALIDDEALILALASGQVGHATLDVFRVEPLPADHPFWHQPNVTVTPHIAAETRPRWSAKSIAENVRRGEAGEPFLHLVDRARGY